MSRKDIIMPKMGESVAEATIISWNKNIGEKIEVDETIIEIATDKVDSEVPCEYSGILVEKLFNENDVVKVGQPFAIIETEEESETISLEKKENPQKDNIKTEKDIEFKEIIQENKNKQEITKINSDKFYSPLVKKIALEENIKIEELEQITGTGRNNRVTKKDILNHLKTQNSTSKKVQQNIVEETNQSFNTTINQSNNDEILEMDRMRKMIANHMVMSKQTSAHVTSFTEVDVTEIVNWRNKIKKQYIEKYKEKITFTPIFIESIVKSIKDFPKINSSVEGDNIRIHKNINIGMATALKNGNLIVPVIHNADMMNLFGLTKTVNDLATRSRNNQLKPDEVSKGTFTVTNVGSFGSLMGTPIINQPQVAILAIGAIKKKPVVIETPQGDFVGIRHMMFLSLSYDHRIIDGALGGMFLQRIQNYLEDFDNSTNI
tara:strand:+ start:1134 stop:2435 length:1302 start_codon:yes stop_codon:yes gene_type:complete